MKKSIISFLIFLIISCFIYSQNIKSMEFHNQEITDILLVLAQSSGTSIIPDETVEGKASFYFSESSLESALDTFLATYKLYYEKNDSYISVSKIKVSYDKENNTASVKADNVSSESILRKLSNKIGKTILYDTLPSAFISVDINDLPIEEILSIVIKKFPDYIIENNDSYYYVKKYTEKSKIQQKTDSEVLVKTGNLYNLNLERGRFLEVLTKLFKLQNVEYSLFVQSDTQLENLYFQNKDFKTLLNLLLEQGNADYVEKDGIYYVIDLQKKGVTSKLKTTHIISMKWISAQDITLLIPPELISSSAIKIDKNTNSILLIGTEEEIMPLKNFIEEVDIPLGGLKYEKIPIKYLDAKNVITLIPSRMVQNPPVLIPNTNSLLVCGTNETINNLKVFINDIDSKNAGIPIKLKYIQTETFLKNLPPSISKENIIDSGFPNLVFYTGSEENKNLFLYELGLIDKPQPQIKYQLLVIQYTKNDSESFDSSIKFNKTDGIENFVMEGELSKILGLNFDIISKFGYQFAVRLDAALTNNTANVFSDTTLNAISGQEIKFQNTDTYRYLETEYNSTTGTSSTTQQITSGLIVSLNGWVSGDNMITMSVNATVSKQNSDSGTTSSNLPSTSERVVTTQVRTMSGEPVIISGLLKDDITEYVTKIPFLGKLPLLGKLFTTKSSKKEKTEIVIYIVPHLLKEVELENSDSLNLERYYTNFIGQKNATY